MGKFMAYWIDADNGNIRPLVTALREIDCRVAESCAASFHQALDAFQALKKSKRQPSLFVTTTAQRSPTFISRMSLAAAQLPVCSRAMRRDGSPPTLQAAGVAER
jgi:hypothetical protein